MYQVFGSFFCVFLSIVLLESSSVIAEFDVSSRPKTLNHKNSDEDGKFPWHSLRLPQTLFPSNYKITLQTDLKLFRVNGRVSIRVNCAHTTNKVIVHLREMNVTKTEVFEKKQDNDVPEGVLEIKKDEEMIEREYRTHRATKLHVTRTMQNETLEMFLIEVNKNLTPQQIYEIYIEFEYPLTDDLLGFYRSSYTTESGEKR